MTQENRELLLEDLCARLPYGFIVHRYSDNVDIKINTIDDFSHFLEYSEGEDFKPYLRPMSSMTEGERLELSMLSNNDSVKFYLQGKDVKLCFMYGDCLQFYKVFDWLNAHHFDYRGLIEKGLALEAPKGMYNKH